jgi:hypothetical protein
MIALSSDFPKASEMLQVFDRRIFSTKNQIFNRNVLEVTSFFG